MKWYFGFNQQASQWFGDMVRVAVATAATHAPHLEPHCVYDGDGETDLTRWLRDRGVTIEPAVAPLRDRFAAPDILARNAGSGYDPVAARGYYLCLAVPQAALGTADYVLFTDCDVMFTGPVDLKEFTPSLLAAVPEMLDVRHPAPAEGGNGFNSGVMVMNLSGMCARMPAIAAALERHGYHHFPEARATYDQGALNTAIREPDWDRLPQALNWRPVFGVNPDASIVHWHGPKPRHVERTLATGSTKAPDETMRAMLEGAADAYRHYYQLFREALNDA